jgi:hypothetical protein
MKATPEILQKFRVTEERVYQIQHLIMYWSSREIYEFSGYFNKKNVENMVNKEFLKPNEHALAMEILAEYFEGHKFDRDWNRL